MDTKVVETLGAFTPERIEGILQLVDSGVTFGGSFARGLLVLVRELQLERSGSFLDIRSPDQVPDWPPMRNEGGLSVGSDVSVPVLALVDRWGWHPVVKRCDDDVHPVRYFWEDPTGFFRPEDLQGRLRCWVNLPSIPAGV